MKNKPFIDTLKKLNQCAFPQNLIDKEKFNFVKNKFESNASNDDGLLSRITSRTIDTYKNDVRNKSDTEDHALRMYLRDLLYFGKPEVASFVKRYDVLKQVLERLNSFIDTNYSDQIKNAKTKITNKMIELCKDIDDTLARELFTKYANKLGMRKGYVANLIHVNDTSNNKRKVTEELKGRVHKNQFHGGTFLSHLKESHIKFLIKIAQNGIKVDPTNVATRLSVYNSLSKPNDPDRIAAEKATFKNSYMILNTLHSRTGGSLDPRAWRNLYLKERGENSNVLKKLNTLIKQKNMCVKINEPQRKTQNKNKSTQKYKTQNITHKFLCDKVFPELTDR